MIKYLSKKFSEIGALPMAFFKFGSTVVVSALLAICVLCYKESQLGSVGLELYYAPMLEYVLTAFIIFWGGTFLLDIAEKEKNAGK